MARQVVVHAEARELLRETVLTTYGRATNTLNVFKIQPWTEEQLAEARQRQRLDMAYDAYVRRSGDDDMARQTVLHATIRNPAKVVETATLMAAVEAIQNRIAGIPQGITEFVRGEEWNAFDPTVGGAKSAARAIKTFLEENGFVVAQTTKRLADDAAPLEVLSYSGDIEALAERLVNA